MKTIKILFILSIIILSCNRKSNNNNNSNGKNKSNDSIFVVNKAFSIGDVRRYGVFPDKGIGQHPYLLKDKLEVLLDVAEMGITLSFPRGLYDRTFNIVNRKDVKIYSENAIFSGAINIKDSKGVVINGTIGSLIQFYTRDSEDIIAGTIVVESDTELSGNNGRSRGCSIHGGSKNIKIKKIIVSDLGSGIDYKYVKAGLTIHGHNNEPEDIVIDSVIIESSDRHGVYLTGEDIIIKFLNIRKFGVGSYEGMSPMEGGIEGEQYKFAGLWIKNCHDSFIDKVVINTENSKGEYIYNFDIGESFRPFDIDSLIIKGKSRGLIKRQLSRTGVKVGKILKQL